MKYTQPIALTFTLVMPTLGKVQVRPVVNERGKFVWRSETKESTAPLSTDHLAITYQLEV